MKSFILILLLGLTSCVSGPKAETRESFVQIDSLYNKFNSLAESHGKSQPHTFRYMFTHLKDTKIGHTIAGCVNIPAFDSKRVKGWEKISKYNQDNLLDSQGKPFIFIDPKGWNRLNETEREITMFHELGHCYLDLDHVNQKVCQETKTIMCEKIQEIDIRSYEKDPTPYINDLFK